MRNAGFGKLNSIRSLVLGLAVVGLGTLATPAPSQAGIFISVRFGPPVLPVYVQPPIPGEGYIWTPGYWAYADLSGYYWVPGTWVLAPQPGYLWTPPYWGFENGFYGFHPGYWGLHVGFYGGVNYGFGYHGVGFDGGFWDHGAFRYNAAYSNFGGVVIHNTYNRTVVINNVSHVSYNGGPGGVPYRASAQEMAVAHENHIQATAMQAQHEHAAVSNRQQWASQNHGSPAFAATARPGEFNHPAALSHPAAQPGGMNHPAAVAHPQAQAPVHTQAQAPVHPQAQTPVHPQAQAPVHPQTQAPAHPQAEAQHEGHGQSGGKAPVKAAPKGEHPEHKQ